MHLLTRWIKLGGEARGQALSPLDMYESYNSTTNTRGVKRQNFPGVLLGILGGTVPPGSSNPYPISDQKM